MKKPNRALHDIARHVIESRSSSSGGPSTVTAAAMQRASGELYGILETTLGAAGVEALINRAIQIAARDYPWLAEVRVVPSAASPLAGLSEAAENYDDVSAGFAAILATILWLLIMFIGEDLTLRFVRHAWPDVSFSRLSEAQGHER